MKILSIIVISILLGSCKPVNNLISKNPERQENQQESHSIDSINLGKEISTNTETDIDSKIKAVFDGIACYGLSKSYEVTKNDLDFDGIDEIIIFYWGSCFCGTGGCSTQIYKQRNAALKLIGDFGLTRVPFYLKKEPNRKWKDIVFFSSGGGAKPTQRIYMFNDEEYVLAEEIASSNNLYEEYKIRSESDKNLERIFVDAHEKIYGKN
ncbi:MAG: hypothetical protein P8H25_03410 [Flavobacteriaceae bacterium]|nr:hypothetical protein [Flavobacteriaceae bacterium]